MAAAPIASWVLGEFETSSGALAAARALRAAGHSALDLYSPFPVEGSSEALGLRPSPVPRFALAGGLLGAGGGYLMQWWMNAVDYRLDVGGRAAHAFPSFVPITFELGVLIASLSIFFGVIGWCFGLPRVHHPVFEAEAFRSAAVDRFWISVEVTGGEVEKAVADLRRLGAAQVATVPEATP